MASDFCVNFDENHILETLNLNHKQNFNLRND